MTAVPEPVGTPGQAAGIDQHSIGYRVHAHAFNKLTEWLVTDQRFVPLSVRDHIATAIVGAIEPLIREDERKRQPQPAPGPSCEWCTHPKLKHEVGQGRCFGRHDDATACKCTSFTPAREQPEPQPAPGVTVDALAAALDGREIVVIAGNGWERRRARDPHALAGELLGVIDARLTGEQPQPAPDSRRALLDIIDVVEHLDEPGPEADHIRLLAEYGLGEAAHADGVPQPAPGDDPFGVPIVRSGKPEIRTIAQPAPELAANKADHTELEDACVAAHGRIAELEAEGARLRALLEDQGRGDEAREFLTPAEAALRLRVDRRTLSRMVAAGRLTPDRTPGGHRRYRAAEIEVVRLERAGKEAR